MLTLRQKQALDAIEDFTRHNGFPPTVREIGLMMGLKSSSEVMRHLRALKSKGCLTLKELEDLLASA